LDPITGELTTCENLEVQPELSQLYGYLKARGGINALDNFDADCLRVFSREVLGKIKGGDLSWESMVPEPVANVIKSRNYFDYQPA
jgi:hypothetical protein